MKPQTIAKSIAIGNPADGYYVLKAVRESGGWGESVTDEEIVDGIKLLARTEGIFTEPAGGTTVAVTKKLIEQGRIPRDESIVISVTGNGYKTLEAVLDSVEQPFAHPGAARRLRRALRAAARQPRGVRRLTPDRHRDRRTIIMVQVRVPDPAAQAHRRRRGRRGRGRAPSPRSSTDLDTPLPGHQGPHLRRVRARSAASSTSS